MFSCVRACVRAVCARVWRLPAALAQVITGSYLMPKDKGPKKAARGEDGEEEEQQERGEDGSVGYEFVKDYKFNIVHYVSFAAEGVVWPLSFLLCSSL